MENLFIFCLLLAIVSNWSEAAPTDQQTNDIRWRLVSGLDTGYEYTNKLHDRLQVCEEPLLNVTGTLRGILHNLCQVMEIQGLLAKVDNGSDLNAILEQNILDTCQWLNYLVKQNISDIVASTRFRQLNNTCEVGNAPRLGQYCLEQRFSTFYSTIYHPASDFYADTVTNQDIPTWLETSDIPLEDANHIKNTINSSSVSCTD